MKFYSDNDSLIIYFEGKLSADNALIIEEELNNIISSNNPKKNYF